MGVEMLKLLDLCSGIGGFSLGLERTGGFQTVAFCEIDHWAQKVLKKHWPDIPIYDDIRTLEHEGPIDVISAGYPCQPFSYAGQRKGEEDDRHIWPFVFGLIKKHRPTWFIGENVAGHITMGLDSVLSDLECEAYACRTFVVPACAVDAKHRRDRVWILANNDRKHSPAPRTSKVQTASTIAAIATSKQSEFVAYTSGERLQGGKKTRNNEKNREKSRNKQLARRGLPQCRTWSVEPNVGRVANGIPRRVDRLRGLGNAVVPQIPEIIGNAILETYK